MGTGAGTGRASTADGECSPGEPGVSGSAGRAGFGARARFDLAGEGAGDLEANAGAEALATALALASRRLGYGALARACLGDTPSPPLH